LAGQVALITGGATGIGQAIARKLAQAGAILSLAQHQTSLDETRAMIEAEGGHVAAWDVDVRNSGSVNAWIDSSTRQLGPAALLIAGAGILTRRRVADMSDEEWHRVIDIDLHGVFYCCRAALPAMLEAGYGRILCISSTVGGTTGYTEHAHYAAAKAGVEGFVRSLALEVASKGVTVNTLVPGFILSPQTLSGHSVGSGGLDRAAEQLIPVNFVGQPDDVTDLSLFLVSPASRYCTGGRYFVDGGLTLNDPWI
jgi:3-oxoacyl-[acyl-carrier protein] reductase